MKNSWLFFGYFFFFNTRERGNKIIIHFACYSHTSFLKDTRHSLSCQARSIELLKSHDHEISFPLSPLYKEMPLKCRIYIYISITVPRSARASRVLSFRLENKFIDVFCCWRFIFRKKNLRNGCLTYNESSTYNYCFLMQKYPVIYMRTLFRARFKSCTLLSK